MAEVVLDSSAVIAFLRGEPGRDVVSAILFGALVSSVNLAEVVTKLIERGSPPIEARETVGGLPIDVQPASPELGLAAGLLHARTRSRSLSLGDRFCLALAMETGLPVLTADRAWTELGLDLDIRLIR